MQQVLQISTREFREKQKTAILTPADDDEEKWLTPEMQAMIDQALQEIKEGKGKKYTLKQIEKLLGL
jgi:hypothetical protein